MKIGDLFHLVRAVTTSINVYEVIVIGSQSILGSYPNAHKDLLKSDEADFIPILSPEQLMAYDTQHYSDLIEGGFGKNSRFEKAFGVYADGCDFTTASLPIDWKDRLIPVQNEETDLKIALFLDPYDLAVAKIIAFREKDVNFVKTMYDEDMLISKVLKERLATVPNIEQARKDKLNIWIDNQEKIKLHRLMKKSATLVLDDVNIQPMLFKEMKETESLNPKNKNGKEVKKTPL